MSDDTTMGAETGTQERKERGPAKFGERYLHRYSWSPEMVWINRADGEATVFGYVGAPQARDVVNEPGHVMDDVWELLPPAKQGERYRQREHGLVVEITEASESCTAYTFANNGCTVRHAKGWVMEPWLWERVVGGPDMLLPIVRDTEEQVVKLTPEGAPQRMVFGGGRGWGWGDALAEPTTGVFDGLTIAQLLAAVRSAGLTRSRERLLMGTFNPPPSHGAPTRETFSADLRSLSRVDARVWLSNAALLAASLPEAEIFSVARDRLSNRGEQGQTFRAPMAVWQVADTLAGVKDYAGITGEGRDFAVARRAELARLFHAMLVNPGLTDLSTHLSEEEAVRVLEGAPTFPLRELGRKARETWQGSRPSPLPVSVDWGFGTVGWCTAKVGALHVAAYPGGDWFIARDGTTLIRGDLGKGVTIAAVREHVEDELRRIGALAPRPRTGDRFERATEALLKMVDAPYEDRVRLRFEVWEELCAYEREQGKTTKPDGTWLVPWTMRDEEQIAKALVESRTLRLWNTPDPERVDRAEKVLFGVKGAVSWDKLEGLVELDDPWWGAHASALFAFISDRLHVEATPPPTLPMLVPEKDGLFRVDRGPAVVLPLTWTGEIFVWTSGAHEGEQLHEESLPGVELREVRIALTVDTTKAAAARAILHAFEHALAEVVRWLREDREAASVEVIR